ncbi:LOW QUALITY PROTEIN: sesquipedalian-1-like [Scyliorhinus torazame]|uniref:LOW QUALITY PROTEIN: sesquipedalian-1-like n=1 Tax=Scyliorhinus torazame TaxID=75743 RepID=UPI003B5C1907
MKLNVRAVSRYALGPAPADRQGFLLKKGELNPSYQRRWFVLRGNLLFYFERAGESEPQGLVLLEGCVVELCESATEGSPFALSCGGGPGLRQYKFVAEAQAEQEGWVRALSSASVSYLRLLVLDLEKQYEGLSPSGWGGAPVPGPGAAPPPDGQRHPQVAPNSGAGQGTPPPPSPCPPPPVPGVAPDNFLSLHQRYGEAVERARREWQRLHGAGGTCQAAVAR